MPYDMDDIEIAISILHHREKMDDHFVKEWMEDPCHMDLLEEMAYIRMVAAEEKEEWNTDDIYRLPGRLSLRKIYYMWAVAACVLLACGVWMMWEQQEEIQITRIEKRDVIVPGDCKAFLILGDGKIVDLYPGRKEIPGQTEQGIRNDSLEGLKYRSVENLPGEKEEEYNILKVPTGGFYKVQLADGTKVWLNAESELRYPVRFTGSERNVWLTGEGYFEVAKDEYKCFHVHLEQSVVTVLGTRFNINAYRDESKIYTTLVEGSVQFYAGPSRKKVVLKPDRQCVLDIETGQVDVHEVEAGVFTAWADGKFVFRSMNLEEIMKQLERWYDFKTVYRDPEIKAYTFRGAIERYSRIEDVFKAIELTTDVEFDIRGKEVYVSRKART